MVKTSSTKSAKLKKDGAGVGSDSRAGRNRNELDGSEMDNIKIDGGRVRDDKVGKKNQKISKSKNLFKSKKTVESDFLTSRAKLVFTKLRKIFVKAPILCYFDLKRYIRVETDISGYVIGRIFCQLTLNDLGR